MRLTNALPACRIACASAATLALLFFTGCNTSCDEAIDEFCSATTLEDLRAAISTLDESCRSEGPSVVVEENCPDHACAEGKRFFCEAFREGSQNDVLEADGFLLSVCGEDSAEAYKLELNRRIAAIGEEFGPDAFDRLSCP